MIKALNNKFSHSFLFKVCALESGTARHGYPDEVKYILDTDHPSRYIELAHAINDNQRIEIVLIQHEFGLFHREGEDAFLPFLYRLTKPAVIVFHTVLPHPDKSLKGKVQDITAVCASVIVMTKNAAQILEEDYGVPAHKIVAIAHGTHLVPHLSKAFLKDKYRLNGRKVLSTFGLLSSGFCNAPPATTNPQVTTQKDTAMSMNTTEPKSINEIDKPTPVDKPASTIQDAEIKIAVKGIKSTEGKMMDMIQMKNRKNMNGM